MINRKRRLKFHPREGILHTRQRQINRKENKGPNILFEVIKVIPSILLAVLSAFFVSMQWFTQHEMQIKDKVDDRKFEIFENTARNLEDYDRLLNSQMRIYFLWMSEHNGVPFQSTEDLGEYVNKLSTNLSEDYQAFVEYPKKLPEFIGGLKVAKKAFGKDTEMIINEFLTNIVLKPDIEYWEGFIEMTKRMGVEPGTKININYTSYYLESDSELGITRYKDRILEAMAKEIDSIQ